METTSLNGEISQFKSKEFTERGAKKAVRLIESAVQKNGTLFNEELLKNIHRTLFYFAPQIGGTYRVSPVGNTAKTRFGDREGIRFVEMEDGQLIKKTIPFEVSGQDLINRMAKYGDWLYSEVESLKRNPDDVLFALRTACEAHYLLSSPRLHPFPDGNGRVSRLLLNALLMINTHELLYYGINIMPVPLIRQPFSSRVRTTAGWQEDPYLSILRQADMTGDLLPLEIFIAEKWCANIDITTGLLQQYLYQLMGKKVNTNDLELLEKFKIRKDQLHTFIKLNNMYDNSKNEQSVHNVPIIF